MDKIKQCVKCGSTTTYVTKEGHEQWGYREDKTYCNICYARLFRDRSKEIYRHKHCRLCNNEIHKGEYHSELTGRWLCNICKKTLLDNMDRAELAHVIPEIEYDESIQDKERAKLWVTKMFEKMKEGYLEYGYNDESYIEFLRVTYKQTNVNFPDTIEAELNEV